jgi:hypothetical protein
MTTTRRLLLAVFVVFMANAADGMAAENRNDFTITTCRATLTI